MIHLQPLSAIETANQAANTANTHRRGTRPTIGLKAAMVFRV